MLENDGEYRRWKIERRNNNRIRRDRAAREELNNDLAQLRERSMQQIGPNQPLDEPERREQFVKAAPTTTNSTTRNNSPVVTPSQPNRNNRNTGFDIQISDAGSSTGRSGGGGGGAIDPISGAIALGLAGAAAAARRRRKKRNGTEEDRSESPE